MTVSVVFQNHFVIISHDDERHLLHVAWQGYQTDAFIKLGCEQLLTLMQQYDAYKILNDSTYTKGIWISATKWLVFEFYPRIKQAGMKGCAHVYGPSGFSNLSADAGLLLLNPKTEKIKAFHSIDEARVWLADL